MSFPFSVYIYSHPSHSASTPQTSEGGQPALIRSTRLGESGWDPSPAREGTTGPFTYDRDSWREGRMGLVMCRSLSEDVVASFAVSLILLGRFVLLCSIADRTDWLECGFPFGKSWTLSVDQSWTDRVRNG